MSDSAGGGGGGEHRGDYAIVSSGREERWGVRSGGGGGSLQRGGGLLSADEAADDDGGLGSEGEREEAAKEGDTTDHAQGTQIHRLEGEWEHNEGGHIEEWHPARDPVQPRAHHHKSSFHQLGVNGLKRGQCTENDKHAPERAGEHDAAAGEDFFQGPVCQVEESHRVQLVCVPQSSHPEGGTACCKHHFQVVNAFSYALLPCWHRLGLWRLQHFWLFRFRPLLSSWHTL